TQQSPSASAFYAVHRFLMKRGHLAEAVRIAERLPSDSELQQRTWQARLRQDGLEAVVNVLENGRFAVALQGRVQARLGLLRGMPLVSLNLSGTDVTDLEPLRDLPLEMLDVSQTSV